MHLTIRPAKREEAKWLSSRLRFEDQRELETVRGATDIDLSTALDYSDETFTARFGPNEDPMVLFGIGHATGEPHRGIPWLLAAHGVERGAIALLREARFWLDAWTPRYRDGLHNIVDARNDLHVRWLRAAGCKLDGTVLIRGHEFIHFTRSNTGV